MPFLKAMLKANADFCLKGDERRWKDLIGLGAEAEAEAASEQGVAAGKGTAETVNAGDCDSLDREGKRQRVSSGAVKGSVAAAEASWDAFKRHYAPFFVADYEWTSKVCAHTLINLGSCQGVH